MNPLQRVRVSLTVALCALTAGTHARAQLSTAQVAVKTISAIPSCASYRVVGACFFLKCKLFKCSVKTSLQVRHFTPDLVVSLYHDVNTHPWDYGRLVANTTDSIGNKLLKSTIDSSGTRYKATRVSANTMFRDADAIGNPVSALSMLLSGGMPSLTSPASVPVPTASELMGFLQHAPSQISQQWQSIPDSYGGGQGAVAKSQINIGSVLGSVGGQLSQVTSVLGQAGNVLNLGQSLAGLGDTVGDLGSAAGSIAGAIGSIGIGSFAVFCPAGAMPFGVHYQSNLDAMSWRGLWPLESLYPASWLPGMREIGSGGTQTWGSLYPRQGTLVQQHPVKGSAVLAQRVADIVSQRNQPHIYRPLDLTPDGWRWFGDQGVRENDPSRTRWQRLYPDPETQCTAFGANDSLSLTSYGDGHLTSDRGVVFNMWRRQECCQRVGNIFLGSIAID